MADSSSKNDNPGILGMAYAKETNNNSKVSGRVVALNVREEDRVVKGQLLAKIDRDICCFSGRGEC